MSTFSKGLVNVLTMKILRVCPQLRHLGFMPCLNIRKSSLRHLWKLGFPHRILSTVHSKCIVWSLLAACSNLFDSEGTICQHGWTDSHFWKMILSPCHYRLPLCCVSPNSLYHNYVLIVCFFLQEYVSWYQDNTFLKKRIHSLSTALSGQPNVVILSTQTSINKVFEQTKSFLNTMLAMFFKNKNCYVLTIGWCIWILKRAWASKWRCWCSQRNMQAHHASC